MPQLPPHTPHTRIQHSFISFLPLFNHPSQVSFFFALLPYPKKGENAHTHTHNNNTHRQNQKKAALEITQELLLFLPTRIQNPSLPARAHICTFLLNPHPFPTKKKTKKTHSSSTLPLLLPRSPFHPLQKSYAAIFLFLCSSCNKKAKQQQKRTRSAIFRSRDFIATMSAALQPAAGVSAQPPHFLPFFCHMALSGSSWK